MQKLNLKYIKILSKVSTKIKISYNNKIWIKAIKQILRFKQRIKKILIVIMINNLTTK